MSEQNKMGKLINIPPERWGTKRSSLENKEKEYEVMGSLNFSFSRVPFDVDGNIDELFDVKNKRVKKPGVEYMKEVDVESIPSDFSNPFDDVATHTFDIGPRIIDELNNETSGAFLKFLKGGEGGRYMLFVGRENELKNLKSFVPKMSTEYLSKFLEVFVKNAELAIEKYGDRAALLII